MLLRVSFLCGLMLAANAHGQVVVRSWPPVQQVQVNDREKQTEFSEFRRQVAQMIQQGSAAAQSKREQDDFKVLQFLLRDLDRYIASAEWDKAGLVRDRMKISLQRAGWVVQDAPRRKAEQERLQFEREQAQRERQHREQMRQRERQHQELMNRLPPPIIRYGR